jgi:hypothetical protein
VGPSVTKIFERSSPLGLPPCSFSYSKQNPTWRNTFVVDDGKAISPSLSFEEWVSVVENGFGLSYA